MTLVTPAADAPVADWTAWWDAFTPEGSLTPDQRFLLELGNGARDLDGEGTQYADRTTLWPRRPLRQLLPRPRQRSRRRSSRRKISRRRRTSPRPRSCRTASNPCRKSMCSTGTAACVATSEGRATYCARAAGPACHGKGFEI